MKSPISLPKSFIIGSSIMVLLGVMSFHYSPTYTSQTPSSASPTCDCYSQSQLFNIPITFNNQVPGDLQAFNNQSQANCFAWQSFISLNWPLNPAKSFGAPNDMSPVLWETFMPKDVLFQSGGVAPPAWGTMVSQEFIALTKSKKIKWKPKAFTKLLTFTSKVTGDTLIDLSFQQAAPGNAPNWLGDQSGNNVWYEIMLNKDYYDFVVANGYYNAKTQHDSINANKAINFPQGEYNGQVGAIELKAAWMEVTNPTSPKWSRYKLSAATVMDPQTLKLRNTTVALVGLHILHKTQNQPTWVWSTFEHIDNVPDSNYATPQYGYNFYSSTCTNRNVQITTPRGDSTVTVTCNANVSPPYYLNQAPSVPIQISRSNSIDTIDARPINKMMQSSIRQFYNNSVWQYYQLVDVIWSQSYQPDSNTPIQAPRNINASSMTSGAHIVANTTMESYVQNTKTCYNCHVYSSIANYPKDAKNNNVFGDFSFAIGAAKYPGTQNVTMSALRSKLRK